MTTIAIDEAFNFHAALSSSPPSSNIPESANAYDFLVGSWELEVLRYWAQNVADRGIKAEVHAGWVLEGRAVQDVWIMPRRSDRTPNLDKKFNMYGTTLRVWDASLEAWRITWSNPAGDHYEQQIGRRIGNDIVQLGTREGGTTTRWTFTDITASSFHWLGEALQPDGKSWRLEGEFRAKRVP